MPGEVKNIPPVCHWKCVTCRGLHHSFLEKHNSKNDPVYNTLKFDCCDTQYRKEKEGTSGLNILYIEYPVVAFIDAANVNRFLNSTVM